jgi:hypothetical protein
MNNNKSALVLGPKPFPQIDKESSTLKLYYLSVYCLPKILILQLAARSGGGSGC